MGQGSGFEQTLSGSATVKVSKSVSYNEHTSFCLWMDGQTYSRLITEPCPSGDSK